MALMGIIESIGKFLRKKVKMFVRYVQLSTYN